MSAAAQAARLKEEAKKYFVSGDYISADSIYSKAIILDPSEPILYSNRALARQKLGLHDLVVLDCQQCLKLNPTAIKAHHLLSQAQLTLRDYDAALASARRAHELCVAAADTKSLPLITAQVLRCRKERWEDLEKRRVREAKTLENDLLSMLQRDKDEALASLSNTHPDTGAATSPAQEDALAADAAQRRDIETEFEAKAVALRDVFDRARSANDKKREVPEWAIDDISFGFMVDPVMTKTGKSYERASIMEHLRRHPSDPLTREPLTVEDLRPNLALRQACDEFLEQNGWAADW